MNTLLLTLFLAAQQPAHVPSANVTGDVVSIDADFAKIQTLGAETSQVIRIVSGVQLAGDRTMLAASRNSGPVSWQLKPGTYQVMAHGYPEDYAFPMRTQVMLSVVIAEPGRMEKIRSSLNRISASIAELDSARKELTTLAPTAVEIQTALDTKP